MHGVVLIGVKMDGVISVGGGMDDVVSVGGGMDDGPVASDAPHVYIV